MNDIISCHIMSFHLISFHLISKWFQKGLEAICGAHEVEFSDVDIQV